MIRPMAKRKRSEHYVNNKEFLAALIKYREDKEIALIKELPKPPIPRYIGECFLKIANHLSFKPNFVNYMFKEDMISDGIENCVQYIKNNNGIYVLEINPRFGGGSVLSLKADPSIIDKYVNIALDKPYLRHYNEPKKLTMKRYYAEVYE